MKISRAWLQDYIGEPLPDAAVMHDALTFHSCEVEEVLADGTGSVGDAPYGDDVVMDVKVLADRASYALSHRGMASELAAALALPLVNDPLEAPPFDAAAHASEGLSVAIDDAARCTRYCAVRMDGVAVGSSPEWLRTRLTAVGQRSINNVVDATNYVMLSLGQPLHAFDAGKLSGTAGATEEISIRVRASQEGETITALGGVEYTLPVGTQLITSGATNQPLAIAGIKGGVAAEVDSTTTSIVLEAACFDGSTTRRAAQALKLFTDASVRFQNNLSPELVGHGMREVVALVEQIAGGRVAAATDCYPAPASPRTPVVATLSHIEAILGTSVSESDAAEALTRLQLSHTIADGTVTVVPPFWRNDLAMAADLAEEIGRVLGYDRIAPVLLPPLATRSESATFAGLERIRDTLVGLGFTEISTPSFAETGDVRLANPLQSDKPFLRATLVDNMTSALSRAKEYAPLALGPEKRVLLFELGTVFTKNEEHFALALGYEPLAEKRTPAVLSQALDALRDLSTIGAPASSQDQSVVEVSLASIDFNAFAPAAHEPPHHELGMFKPFSAYPFASRDVAVWVPADTQESEVATAILGAAGEYALRMDCFDRFEKDGRTSYAFRLIFQSFERTLTDGDLDPAMKAVYDAIAAKTDWEAR